MNEEGTEYSQHHRRSIRLKGFDYTGPGAYFITLATWRREELFGEIEEDQMQLSPLGGIVQAEWFHSAAIRKEIRLFEDEFVVMPNHLHGIVRFVNVGADGIRPAEGQPGSKMLRGVDISGDIFTGERAHHDNIIGDGITEKGARKVDIFEGIIIKQGARRAPLQRAPRSLSSFIAGFKGSVTARASRELNYSNIWQRNYYERIIRNEAELKSIWNYIDTNVLHWQEDRNNLAMQNQPFLQDAP